MKKKVFFCILSVFLLCSLSHATLSFKMTCDDSEIAVGEETTIIISAYDDQAVTDYGLVEWQFDMWLLAEDDGILEVVSWSVFEESVYLMAWCEPTAVDEPTTGSVNSFGAFQLSDDPASNLGVGDYTPLASVTIRGLAEGTASYNLGSLTSAENFYGRFREDESSGVTATFNCANSVVTYTVVPEPTSLLILSGLSVMGYFRRKRGR